MREWREEAWYKFDPEGGGVVVDALALPSHDIVLELEGAGAKGQRSRDEGARALQVTRQHLHRTHSSLVQRPSVCRLLLSLLYKV